MSDFSFSIGADDVARKIVENGLEQFNFNAIGPYAYQNFELYARDDAGTVVAGMFGQSGMDWLYIDFFWISDDLRGAGLGSRMLAEAEAEAKRRQCVGLYLYTYSFQAQGFYEKCGFTVMGVLEDCPVGHRKIFLNKRL